MGEKLSQEFKKHYEKLQEMQENGEDIHQETFSIPVEDKEKRAKVHAWIAANARAMNSETKQSNIVIQVKNPNKRQKFSSKKQLYEAGKVPDYLNMVLKV